MTEGGKASSLRIVQQAGYSVPRFVVLLQVECTSERIQKILVNELVGVSLFAVRSSCAEEDGKEKSFAGHFYSGIAVLPQDIEEECRKVIASYNGGDGAVILQEFICSTAAGVVFSHAGKEKMVINATLGLCESVVKGKSCDEYVVNREDGSVVSEKIEEKKELLYYRHNQFEKDIASSRALDEKQLELLVKKSIGLENLFGCPQDIEFCFLDEKLYILQSRPVTREIFFEKEIYLYDSANIAESYSGIVLPLTLSFVELVYARVYQDLVCASGVGRKKVEEHKELFDGLTASFYGRLYYNMNNWYKMMSFFPGYQRNKNNLQLMISSNIKEEIERGIKPSKIFSVYYYVLVLVKLIFFPITVFLFKNNIKKTLARYARISIEEMTYEECISLFYKLLKGPLTSWYIAVENDTALMTLLGKIHSTDKNSFNETRITSDTVSANQVVELKKMADVLMGDPHMSDAISNKDHIAFTKELSRNIVAQNTYNEYFVTYGGRFANELKLESDDLKEDFGKFSSLIEIYSKTDIIKSGLTAHNSKRGLFVSLIRFFATNREEMRLLRSNMFSVVRRIFMRIGAVYYEKGLIKEAKDVFYLTVDEVIYNQLSEEEKFSQHIAQRKKEYESYVSLLPPTHFSLAEGQVLDVKSEISDDNDSLFGSPSSPGIVSGRVRVFNGFSIPDTIDFDILVTSHTDPGWVPLIGLSKGLIIEFGGVLSHASIVSRELGIPSVIGVKNATKILQTGDVVEINGTLGTIVIKNKTV
jgi:rifampicin phosphotransferase